MFGFLKNLFGGIFAFLGKLLGFQKSEYALEFEAAPSATPSTASQPAKAQPAQAAASKATTPDSAKAPAPAAKAQPTKSEAAKPKTNTAKDSQPAAKPQAAKAVEPAKAPQYVGGFATNYSLPIATSTRRRPGANMNSFLNLARQVKTTR